ncbi:hypothetical protein Dsin_011959 [Dipteronia sinensis]|uniref:Reverse transcriptase zinc-binding domain-containing protein n=1 Tax=Dipteronia sinensis TaxID=43782 RepID=A0AAE0E7Q4_9ROSI|nr:hypothetical protein Dsin_011959 [Dipteronia sinensis]
MDSIMWHYEKLGSFSVSSGYKFDCNEGSNPGSSALSGDVSWWKFLWRMKIPLKVKIFVWRACENWIPTRTNLLLRKVPSDSICPCCDQKAETTMHALWCCPLLRPIREVCGFTKDCWGDDNSMFLDFMIYCRRQLVQEEMDLICQILWRGWYNRNRGVHDAAKMCNKEVVPCARAFQEEYLLANHALNAEVSDRRGNGPIWQPPYKGTYKINTDAALSVGDGIVGVGIIIRDYVGNVIASSAQAVQYGCCVLIAEALAIKKCLLLARHVGLELGFIESDAQVAVNLINNPDIPYSEVGLIIKDIKSLLEEFSDFVN